MLDPRGFVASCNSTNFFIVLGIMAVMAAAILGLSRWRGWI